MITVGKFVNLDLNNGFGMSCFEITSLSGPQPAVASTTVSVYGDCETCKAANGVICPELRRLDPCCICLPNIPYNAWIPYNITAGIMIADDNLCWEIGGINTTGGTANKTFISLYSEAVDCLTCVSENPCPTTPTPTPTQTSTPPVTQTKTPSPTPPVTQTKTPSSTPPVTPTRTASPVPISFSYYEVYEIPSATCLNGDGPFVMRTTNSYILGRFFDNGTCYEITDTRPGPSFNFNYNGSTFVGCSGCFALP